MRRLNVKETSRREVAEKFGFSLPKNMNNPLFIRSNSKGIINWLKAPIYSFEELEKRGKYSIIK